MPVPMDATIADFHAYPDAAGHFGRYGGRFVPETLMGALRRADLCLADRPHLAVERIERTPRGKAQLLLQHLDIASYFGAPVDA